MGECEAHKLLPKNMLTVTLAGRSVQAKIDTGADLNFISSDIVDSLPVQFKNRLKKQNSKFTVANQRTVTAKGIITLPVTIHNQRFSVKFTVFDDPTYDMFLGHPFLKNNRAVLDFSKDTVTLCSNIPIHSQEHITLEPYSEAIVPGKLYNSVQNLTPGLCSVFPTINQKGILVANTAVTVNDDLVPIRIFNGTSHPQKINRGERLATFEVWDDNIEVIDYDFGRDRTDHSHPHLASCTEGPTTSKPPKYTQPDIDWAKSEVNDEQRQQLKDLVNEFSDCFVDPVTKELGLTDMISCKIDTYPDAEPVHKYPYRLAPSQREEMENIVQQQLKQGLIEVTEDGAWASPALLVKKASGGFRLVVDFRALNAATIPKILRIPRLDDVLDSVGETKPQFFSVFDCTQGFHQIPLDPQSRHLTGFICSGGKYRYKTMPQGLKTAPATFQALMDTLLRGVQFKFVCAYIDDVICYSATFEQHLEHVREVLSRFRKANLKLHPKKCAFAVKKVTFLGHVLTPEGMSPNPQKLEAITSYPVPKKLKQVRGFLGLVGFYRKYIMNFAQMARPLYDLTKKDVPFVWSSECQEAFDALKTALTSDSVLAFPDFNETFILATDASKTGLGACLSQNQGGKLRPIAFAGRGFNKAESNYTTTEQELLAVVYAIQQFKVYLLGKKFEIHTDHAALRWLLDKKETEGRLARWVTFLQQYQYDIYHVKGKENCVPDALSRRQYEVTHTPVDDAIEAYPDLDTIMLSPEHDICAAISHPELPLPESPVETDHTEQITCRKSPELPTLASVSARDKRRKRLKPQLVKTSRQHWQEYDFSKEKVAAEQKADPHCKLYIDYLTRGKLPTDSRDVTHVLRRSEDYIVIRGILYKIFTSTGPKKQDASASLVVPQNMKAALLKLHHDDKMGGHTGAQRMISLMRYKYYWIGMMRDIKEYVTTCLSCNASKPANRSIRPPLIIRQPAPAPFHTVIIDTIGPFPRTKNQNVHLVVVTDQYSRYCIAWPTPDISGKSIARKFYEKVVCIHGAPKRILSDNGSCFISAMFQELCNMFHIKNVYSTAYHAASQGETERANRTILGQLRNFVSANQKDWDAYIPAIIFSINTTENQLRGYSSYMLVYGRTPTFPAEIDLPEGLDCDRTVFENLSQIVETQARCCKFAEDHLKEQQVKMKAQYDKHATENPIRPGDTVFVFQPKLQTRKTKRKLQRNYHGPYMVSEYNTPTTVILRRMSDGKYLPKSIHVSRLKMGHVRSAVNQWDPLPNAQGDLLTEDDLPGSSFDPYTVDPVDSDSDSDDDEAHPRRQGLRPRRHTTLPDPTPRASTTRDPQPQDPQPQNTQPQNHQPQGNQIVVQADIHPPPRTQPRPRGRPRGRKSDPVPQSNPNTPPTRNTTVPAASFTQDGVLVKVSEVLRVRATRGMVMYYCTKCDGGEQWIHKAQANPALIEMARPLEY